MKSHYLGRSPSTRFRDSHVSCCYMFEPSMLAFFRKYQIPLSCCFCIVLSLYIMTAAARGQLKNDPIGPLLLWLIRPLQIVAHSTTTLINGMQERHLTVAG